MKTKETVKFIESQGKVGMKLGLDNIKLLLEKLGNPQEDQKYIHVAGSNGKGSICRIIEEVLVNNNYKIGKYSSPHITRFNERITINKIDISDEDLSRLFQIVKEKSDELVEEGHPAPTRFEIETAIAFLYFKEKNTDLNIIEVGLGGRLDATNIIPSPIISIISSISLEHTEYLGDTLEKVAAEKAGIIKNNTNLIIAPQPKEALDSILKVANSKKLNDLEILNSDNAKIISSNLNSQIIEIDKNDYHTNLLGDYQLYNLQTALGALNNLMNLGFDINREILANSLMTIENPGRFEIISERPLIILDGAHNPDGIKQLTKSLRTYFKDVKVNLFFGAIKEKEIEKSLRDLLPLVKEVYLIEPDSLEKLTNREVKEIIENIYKGIKITELNSTEELIEVLKNKEGINLITGSLYLLAKVRGKIKGAFRS